MPSSPSSDNLSALRSDFDRAMGSKQALQEQERRITRAIRDLNDEVALLDLVIELFRQLVDREITQGVSMVEALQTEGLQAVFWDQNLRVESSVQVERGKVAVGLTVAQTDKGVTVKGDPGAAFGGAVQTVMSVILRILVIYLRGLRPVLFLDESLPAFDPEYVIRMGQFLAVLCKRLGMDILLVTHNPSLVEAANRAYKIEKRGGSVRFIEVINR